MELKHLKIFHPLNERCLVACHDFERESMKHNSVTKCLLTVLESKRKEESWKRE
jgi:hypothetical protein